MTWVKENTILADIYALLPVHVFAQCVHAAKSSLAESTDKAKRKNCRIHANISLLFEGLHVHSDTSAAQTWVKENTTS